MRLERKMRDYCRLVAHFGRIEFGVIPKVNGHIFSLL